MAEYSSTEREQDEHALPNIEVFEWTAREYAAQDETLVWEYSRRHEYRLAGMNSRVTELMIDAIVEEQNITGGWFYWYCLPGCLPDTEAVGPFGSYAEALQDARAQ